MTLEISHQEFVQKLDLKIEDLEIENERLRNELLFEQKTRKRPLSTYTGSDEIVRKLQEQIITLQNDLIAQDETLQNRTKEF